MKKDIVCFVRIS